MASFWEVETINNITNSIFFLSLWLTSYTYLGGGLMQLYSFWPKHQKQLVLLAPVTAALAGFDDLYHKIYYVRN